MTNTTTIIAIAIGLLLFLIIKKFYYSITNKEIKIEKEKLTETNTTTEKKRNFEKEQLLNDIEKLRKTYEQSTEVYKAEAKAEISKQIAQKKADSSWNYDREIKNLEAKEFANSIDKKLFNYIFLQVEIIDDEMVSMYAEIVKALIDYELRDIQDQHIRLCDKWHRDRQILEELQIKEIKSYLAKKQQELELREARIVKIESAQKILNSELVEKINKEID
jgi:hypothetical protein